VLHYPTYNSPVLLSGRRSLLGYPGHIWSQGLDASGRAEQIRRFYAGEAQAGWVVPQRRVDCFLIGPQERAGLPIEGARLSGWPVLLTAGAYELRCAAGSCAPAGGAR
jgi:hypothetical protein